MGHLLFRPRPAGGPEFFLWGNEPGRAETGILERLAAFGRRAIGRVVTDHLRAEQVRGLRIALSDGVAVLAGLETADLDRVPASVAVWSLAAKLALDLVARERILPLARPGPGGVEARWGVSLAFSDDAQRFTRLARASERPTVLPSPALRWKTGWLSSGLSSSSALRGSSGPWNGSDGGSPFRSSVTAMTEPPKSSAGSCARSCSVG